MNENDPDNFFENIPETEESTFTFDDVSLRVAREAVNINYKESDVSVIILVMTDMKLNQYKRKDCKKCSCNKSRRS